MKKYLIVIICLFCGVFCFGCANDTKIDTSAVVRIHIKANSNSTIDQNIKGDIRNSIIDYLTPLLYSENNFDKAKTIIKNEISNLTKLVDSVLLKNDFKYFCSIKFNNEFFPTRCYGEYKFEANYYDALIIYLGDGAGDNWWCVVYPPLCFVDYGQKNNVVYISKFWEIINKFFNK